MIQNNKLIAEFMGMDSFKDSLASLHQGKINVDVDVYEQAQYHTSWDWLMPVIEKIECTPIDNDDNSDNFFNVMIEVFECNINGGDICICENGHTKREATYNAVVEFINQYNN